MIYKQGNTVNVHAATDAIASVDIYDLTGKRVFASSGINQNDVELPNLSASSQVLIVRVSTVKNELFVKKVQF